MVLLDKPVLLVHEGEPDSIALKKLLYENELLDAVMVYDKHKGNGSYSRSEKSGLFMMNCIHSDHPVTHYSVSETKEQLALMLDAYLKTKSGEDCYPHIVWTCHFMPLYLFYKAHPEICKKLRICAYGSLNLKWAFQGLITQQDERAFSEMIHHGFESLNIFESGYAFGEEDCDMDEFNTPKIFKYFEDTWPDMNSSHLIVRCGDAWNKYRAEDILRRLSQEEDTDDTFKDVSDIFSLTDEQEHIILIRALNTKSAHQSKYRILRNMILSNKQFHMMFSKLAFGIALLSQVLEKHWVPKSIKFLPDVGCVSFVETDPGATLRYFYAHPAERLKMLKLFDSEGVKFLKRSKTCFFLVDK